MTETVYNPTTTSTSQQLPSGTTLFNSVTIGFGLIFIVLGSVVTFIGVWGEEVASTEEKEGFPEGPLERTTNWLVTLLGLFLFIVGIILVFFYFKIKPQPIFTKPRTLEVPLNDLQIMQSSHNSEEKANLMEDKEDGFAHYGRRRFRGHGLTLSRMSNKSTKSTRSSNGKGFGIAPLAMPDDFPSVHSSFTSLYFMEGDWDIDTDDSVTSGEKDEEIAELKEDKEEGGSEEDAKYEKEEQEEKDERSD